MMDPFRHWRDEDNKFLDIDVLNPRTHIKDGRALYTDYEIHVKTNHPEFAIKDLCVRRRYSEFVWLRNRLGINDVMMTTPPSLPGKRIVGKFKGNFLHKRQYGLQNFMNKVVEINAFLSDPALHLFLQTDLPIEQMESYLQHRVLLSNIRDRVIILQKTKELRLKKDLDDQASRPCNIKTCNLKKTMSLDSIKAANKDSANKDVKEGGRGWSRYIGDGYCAWEVTTDRDVTDFSRKGANYTRTRNMTATAYVLPGGQLRLADDTSNDTSKQELNNCKPTMLHRSSSWHGNTSDLIDLMLDGYDVIKQPIKVKKENLSDMESMTFSQGSKFSSSGTWQYDSSDDGIEIDMSQKLSEYTIITMPPNGITATSAIPTVTTSIDNGFHHSLSASYEYQG